MSITRQMREMGLNVRVFSAVPYGLLPDYYKQLGKEAEFVYSGSFWETSLPYPGKLEFVAAYRKSSTALPPFSRPVRMPRAKSLRRWYDGPVAWIPTSSARPCWR